MSPTSATSASTERSGSFQAVPTEKQLHILTHLVTPQPPDFRNFQEQRDFKRGLASLAYFAKTCKLNHNIAAPILSSLKTRYRGAWWIYCRYHFEPHQYAQSILNDRLLASRETCFDPGAGIMPVRRICGVEAMRAGSSPGENESDDGSDDEEEDPVFAATARGSGCLLFSPISQISKYSICPPTSGSTG